MTQNEIEKLAAAINAELIETHISWVLLTPQYTYKVKKPVKTTFLNFSTLNRRKFYCEEELRLNKEFTSKIYLKVIPIMKDDYVSFLNKGKIIDYAVQMKTLDRSKIMAQLLKHNKVKKTEIKNLAKVVAQLHLKASIIHINKRRSLAHEFEDLCIEINKSEFIHQKTKDKIIKLNQKAQLFLSKNKTELNNRKKAGMIREIHGDLHSKNIFLYNPPVLFDRIEFNKEFRTIDVLNEIAYVTVDLEFNSREDLSDFFLKNYISEMGISFNETERKIFSFYKSFTANVRAKVSLISAGQKGMKRKKYMQQFKKYFELMESYIKELD